jgi:hypothetical protein
MALRKESNHADEVQRKQKHEIERHQENCQPRGQEQLREERVLEEEIAPSGLKPA